MSNEGPCFWHILMNYPVFLMNSKGNMKKSIEFLFLLQNLRNFAAMKQNLWTRRMSGTITIFMLLVMSLPMAAQVSSSLTFRRYTTQDGLPQMQAERVWQDSRGYIYIGTLSGLVRFDGRTFTSFLKGKRYNIVSFAEVERKVWALDFRQRWLVGQDGVEKHQLDPDGRWLLNNFNSSDLPGGMLLLEDEQEGHRWIGEMGKALSSHSEEGDVSDGEVTIRPLMSHQLFDYMMPDRKLYMDSLFVYIPTEKGLYRATLGKETPRCVSQQEDFYSLHRWQGKLYAFAADGIYIVEGDSVRLHTPFNGWQTGYGLIVRDAKSELIIADEHSLYSFDGHAVSKLWGGANLIKDILIDRWGRLWVATYQGVYCFFGRHFVNHRLDDENDIIRAVVADAEGRIVMGTLNGKMMVNEHLIYDDPENFFIPSAVQLNNHIYMAGRNDVACISDATISWLGLPYERYQYITGADGHLILVTRQLIADYDPSTGESRVLTEEVPHPWCAAMDGEGCLWVGSTFGLYVLPWHHGRGYRDGGKVEKYDYHQQKLIITTMEADNRGAVFFASGDSLFVIREGEVTELNSQMLGLEGHEVRSLHVSPRGFLVVAAIDGLFVCRISKNYQVSDICFFDHTNGFTMIEPLKASMAETEDGTVWLCGVEEMVSFLPEALIADYQADTFIRPPLRWWEHWWIWIVLTAILLAMVWALTRWYEKYRHNKRMMRLQWEKQEQERLIRAIREEAIKDEQVKLAQSIVKMTDKDAPKQLTLRTTNGTVIIDIADIVYLKANGNYTQLATFSDTDLVLVGLGTLITMLQGHNFVRADRSTVVNVNYISRLNASRRTCVFKSPDGVELSTSLLAPAFKRLETEMGLTFP